MGDLTVRPLETADRAAWERLWTAYLAFYRTDVAPEVKNTTWSRLHDPDEPVWAFGACDGTGGLVAIVHYLFHRSTWTIGPYCYLQDLFTSEAARGRGAGRALIEAVYGEAGRRGRTASTG